MRFKILLGVLLFILCLLVISIVSSQSPAIIELNGDGSWNWVITPSPHVITASPASSQTPWIVTTTPKNTDEPTPTSTLSSATPTREPTPTQAVTLTTLQPTRTPTPSPTVTPTLPPNPDPICWGRVINADNGLRIREVPWGEIIGHVFTGDILAFDAKWYQDFWWYRIEWFDEGDPGYISSNYVELGDGADCSELEDVTPQESHTAALLWHTVPGFNIGNAQAAYTILDDKKIDFGLKPYAGMNACIDALVRGGTCIYRHGAPDCPQGIGVDDPRISALNFLQYGLAARDHLSMYEKSYYEPINECLYGNSTDVRYLHWWSEWLNVYISEAYALGYPKLVIPTLGPGHGDTAMWQVWKSALELNNSHGGLFGEHAYAPIPNCGGDGSLAQCDPYCACRHRTNEEDRQSVGLFINVAITEAASNFGNAPVDVNDFVQWYDIVRHDSWLHSVSMWTAGYHPTWPNANLDSYMVPISRGVQ